MPRDPGQPPRRQKKMQFLCCKVHFLMIYMHVLPVTVTVETATCCPTFGELAGFDIEMFGF